MIDTDTIRDGERFSFLPDTGPEVFFTALTLRQAQEIAIERWSGVPGLILDYEPWSE